MGREINRAQMLLGHLGELRKVGNTTLLISGIANYKEKFYLLAPTREHFNDTLRKAMLVDPAVKDRMLYLRIDRLNGVIVRRLPIAVDADMIQYMLANILREHFNETK